jgi:hypothetical protein
MWKNPSTAQKPTPTAMPTCMPMAQRRGKS